MKKDETENSVASHGSSLVERLKRLRDAPKDESRAGWRGFLCPTCGEQWRETSRDRFSLSGDNCQCCGDWVHPFASSDLPRVEVDSMGNLIEYKRIVITNGIER